MARLNLVNAETLCWIARVGTFTAAAERLFTTQSAVSARMRELEQSLGVPLFEKRGRRVELTLPARRFVERIEPLLHELESALVDPDALAATAGIVRIGMGEITMTWFSRLVPYLREAWPRVSFQIEMDLGYKLKQMLEEGRLDLAVVSGNLTDERLVTQSLGETRMTWVMSSSLLPKGSTLDEVLPELLATRPLWCVSRPSSFFPDATKGLKEAGANLENVCTCNSLHGLIEMAEYGKGISQVPELMVANRLQDGSMISLATHLDVIDLGFTIGRHREQRQPIVNSIMEMVIERSRKNLTAVHDKV